MISPEQLQKVLCASFCAGFDVHAVPSGYAVSSIFTDRSGDRLAFYVASEDSDYRLEDDREYLSRLIAS